MGNERSFGVGKGDGLLPPHGEQGSEQGRTRYHTAPAGDKEIPLFSCEKCSQSAFKGELIVVW